MRIVAGQYRSRPLRGLPGMATRPTSDRLRETLFNILTAGQPEALAGSKWLDLFAGTGAVGLEAISRGAAMVYFVESSREAAAVIRANLHSLNIAAGHTVLERDTKHALRRLDAEGVTCDFCFVDPPYRDADAYGETLGFLSHSHLLRPAAIVIAEHNKQFDPGTHFGHLARYRTLRQGDSALSFYRPT